jgi:carbonic anhydrase
MPAGKHQLPAKDNPREAGRASVRGGSMKDFGRTSPVGDLMLERLIDGNKRYAAGKLSHPNQVFRRWVGPAERQQPFAVILSCSESTAPPEVVFDCGVGDLFVVRVAGLVLSELVLASVEFAVRTWHIPVVVVLGHSHCSAVASALRGEGPPSPFGSLATRLRPALERSRRLPGDAVANGGRAQAQVVAEYMRGAIQTLAGEGGAERLRILAACFNQGSGMVEVLD